MGAIVSTASAEYINYSESLVTRAEKGDQYAPHTLAEAYYQGYGVEEDLEQALSWYQKAASKGNTETECSLGYMYENGEEVDENKAEAFKWYSKAAKTGHPKVQYALGLMLEYGVDSIPKNTPKALEWITKAANNGYNEAQFHLGYYYEEGEFVKKDLQKAIHYYQLAVQQAMPALKII